MFRSCRGNFEREDAGRAEVASAGEEEGNDERAGSDSIAAGVGVAEVGVRELADEGMKKGAVNPCLYWAHFPHFLR